MIASSEGDHDTRFGRANQAAELSNPGGRWGGSETSGAYHRHRYGTPVVSVARRLDRLRGIVLLVFCIIGCIPLVSLAYVLRFV